MKAIKYVYVIGLSAVLSIVGCKRGTNQLSLNHDEVRALNECVLEKAIGQPDSALQMIDQEKLINAARFHVAEQQREIERHKTIMKQLTYVGTCNAIVALLTLLFAAYVVHKRRVVDQKNRSLVRQITEAAKYKKLYEELIVSSSTSHGEEVKKSDFAGSTDNSGNKLSLAEDGVGEASLFNHIHQVIKEKKLYLDPQFDRQTASDYFQITTRAVGAAFAQSSEYAKITDLINQLRLDHAQELMNSHPEMSIDEVSSDSGFAVRRTFSRLFKERFGLTPTEYRSVYLTGIARNESDDANT